MCQIGYSPVAQGFGCEPCAQRSYKDKSGPSECTSCPKGSTALKFGATAVGDCECSPGYTGSVPTCTLCPSGKYSVGGTEPCMSCKVCDSNAVTTGTCLSGTGQSDAVQCTCNAGFAGDGIFCGPTVFEVVSFEQSTLFCQKPGQIIFVYVKTFSAISRASVSASIQFGSDDFTADVLAVNVSQNMSSNMRILTLSIPSSIPNSDFGIAQIVISVTLEDRTEPVVIFPVFKPYVSGPPGIEYFAPQSLYTGTNFTLSIYLVRIKPISNASELEVSSVCLNHSLITVDSSNLQGTILHIYFGEVRIIGAVNTSLIISDSDGVLYSTEAMVVFFLVYSNTISPHRYTLPEKWDCKCSFRLSTRCSGYSTWIPPLISLILMSRCKRNLARILSLMWFP